MEPSFLQAEIDKVDGINKVYRKFPPNSKLVNIKREIIKELTGDDLKKIFIYPKVLDLGNVNLNSTERRSFCIRNEMLTHLSTQI